MQFVWLMECAIAKKPKTAMLAKPVAKIAATILFMDYVYSSILTCIRANYSKVELSK